MDLKQCSKCNETLQRTEFYADKRNRDGLQSNCIHCCKGATSNWRSNNLARAKQTSRESAARWAENNRDLVIARATKWNKTNKSRRAAIGKRNKLKRTSRAVVWADKKKVDAFYAFRDVLNYLTLGLIWYEVDHIVPLNGKNVCGLHVEYNLTVVQRSYNRRKGNSFEIL